MDRRAFLYSVALATAPLFLPDRSVAALGGVVQWRAGAPAELPPEFTRLVKSKTAWRRLRAGPPYQVMFEGDTERPGSSQLNAEHRAGTFACAACDLPLFSSTAKFESGTGWPSFTASLAGRVATKRDFKLILPRTEYHCARCGGHQGHRFADGPRPAGTRRTWSRTSSSSSSGCGSTGPGRSGGGGPSSLRCRG